MSNELPNGNGPISSIIQKDAISTRTYRLWRGVTNESPLHSLVTIVPSSVCCLNVGKHEAIPWEQVWKNTSDNLNLPGAQLNKKLKKLH